jgi:hypothetical protein
MKDQNEISRRVLVKSSVFGVFGAALPGVLFGRNVNISEPETETPAQHDRYPAIRLDIAAEVVGVSHFNLDRLKELVEPRPELARANWDWGFGDWESAISAASHAGRKDIVEYLVGKGAVPTVFTYAMLGAFEAVKGMIDFYPGIQKKYGPHGISLLQHARLALSLDGVDKSKAQQLVNYLDSLGDADGQTWLPVPEAEKAKYLGDYKYGEGKDDGFTIRLNMKKILSLGKLGKSGGALFRIGENSFTYNGAPSVNILFDIQNDKVVSMTLHEPGLVLKAVKIPG